MSEKEFPRDAVLQRTRPSFMPFVSDDEIRRMSMQARLVRYHSNTAVRCVESEIIRSKSFSSRVSQYCDRLKKAGPAGARLYEMMSEAYWGVKTRLSRHLSDEVYVSREFKRHIGRDLDLRNPKTFAEKLQYLKLYDQTPLHEQCADKIRVRDFARSKIPEDALIPLILTSHDVNDINPVRIPNNRFVVKTNHDSGSVQFCRDRNTFDWEKCRNNIKRFMGKRFWEIGRELQYRNIKPKILVEAMIDGENGDLPDYKIYCFGGEPLFIQVDLDRFCGHRRNFFDLEWRRIHVNYNIPGSDKEIKKPDTLGVMLDYARKLSAPFKFSRIDLFSVRGHVYFGEVTFHPYSGFREFTPQCFDMFLGEMIDL